MPNPSSSIPCSKVQSRHHLTHNPPIHQPNHSPSTSHNPLNPTTKSPPKMSSSSTSPSPSTKRLLHELHQYNTSLTTSSTCATQSQSQNQSLNQQPSSSSHPHPDENESIDHLAPISDADLHHWTAILRGPKNTAYEGGKWRLDILVPENYPLAPPAVRFVTRCCHPNVKFEVCLHA